MQIKKNPKYDLSRGSIIFFQIGMILILFSIWQGLEWKSYNTSGKGRDQLVISDNLEEIIPITEQLTTPPPPPPPSVYAAVILEIENESEVEESIIESSETNQDDEILEVEDIKEEVEEEEEIVDVPFAVIENVPIYPGCENEKGNDAKKTCMSEKVKDFIQSKFNIGLAEEIGLEGRQRIFVTFAIDKNGDVVNVRARAPHPKLEEEAIKIVKTLPHMTPGKQRGVPVGVSYGLPITFQIEE